MARPHEAIISTAGIAIFFSILSLIVFLEETLLLLYKVRGGTRESNGNRRITPIMDKRENKLDAY